MAFWGCQLAPGQKKKVESPEGEILHLSQACLHDPKDGKNFLQAVVEGTAYSIACLEKGKKEHDSFDLFFDPTTCAFQNQGKSEVHLTGYFEPDDGMDDEEVAAAGKIAAKSSPKVAAHSSPKKAVAASPKVAVQSSPKSVTPHSPKLAAAVAAARAAEAEESSEELIEEGEESEILEESEEEAPPAKGKASPAAVAKASPKAAAAAAADESDYEEILEEGEESELLEESEEEALPVKKRKGEAAPAGSPAKAAKASPAAAPAGSPKQAGNDQASYVKALVQYIKQHGKTPVSLLGSKVTKPAGAPKMKAVFEANKDKFVVTDGQVTLK